MQSPERAHEDAARVWPPLPLKAWRETYDTLHMWTQIVGKTKLALAPFLNHWWQVTFDVTARGMTTSTLSSGSRVFQVDFDFIDHQLRVCTSEGAVRTIALGPRSVADFYAEFIATLGSLGIEFRINPQPAEVEDGIPFGQDEVHAAYDPDSVQRWWRIMVQVKGVMERYRSSFVGKSSPISFYWGSFDLAQTRFSGRPAPEREWPKGWRFNRLAMNEEQATVGFWPGSDALPEPAFFAYTYPEPPGIRTAAVQPDGARFDLDLAEFILPYEVVRQADAPEQVLLDFFDSTYAAGATLAGWDRLRLEEEPPYLHWKGSTT